jgi:hypothetical protein
MSTICKGEIHRDGAVWQCTGCGHVSTAWDTKHLPIQSRPKYLLACLLEVVRQSRARSNMVAAG